MARSTLNQSAYPKSTLVGMGPVTASEGTLENARGDAYQRDPRKMNGIKEYGRISRTVVQFPPEEETGGRKCK